MLQAYSVALTRGLLESSLLRRILKPWLWNPQLEDCLHYSIQIWDCSHNHLFQSAVAKCWCVRVFSLTHEFSRFMVSTPAMLVCTTRVAINMRKLSWRLLGLLVLVGCRDEFFFGLVVVGKDRQRDEAHNYLAFLCYQPVVPSNVEKC